ncbi:transcriptional regulator of RNA polII, SAGA, subunit-domain-containing protein [Syncephalastrum racemosum]|uniref:Transcriptional regulator of RNA polII, SAGA, subunit-domain-containing protein n=1 Tax=Syncephalastrum racemosum TaxID=13706 RepID=A0A1X2HCK8_SYNRA|nr:transcriptional regulator of RNA polII, SAGA, subunit-domain-containing protein [Syncephalastrum racemosum]
MEEKTSPAPQPSSPAPSPPPRATEADTSNTPKEESEQPSSPSPALDPPGDPEVKQEDQQDSNPQPQAENEVDASQPPVTEAIKPENGDEPTQNGSRDEETTVAPHEQQEQVQQQQQQESSQQQQQQPPSPSPPPPPPSSSDASMPSMTPASTSTTTTITPAMTTADTNGQRNATEEDQETPTPRDTYGLLNQSNSASMTTTPTPAMTLTPNGAPQKKKPVIKGRFPDSMTPTARQDVISLKQQLADALGENGPLYWDALKDFVSGKLNRQEFDFYANLYLSQENAYLHNSFILSTVHNAQTSIAPPSKHRSVGWAKRKRHKDGGEEQELDPRKRKLKLDVMSLSKADRDRLKSLVKAGDKDRLRPFVDKLLGPRISKIPPLPLPKVQPAISAEYSKGLMAPLCADLKELPGPDTLRARMNSIALEHGMLGGVTEEVVSAMMFATESYVKSAIANAVSKRRVNRSIGLHMQMDTAASRALATRLITGTEDVATPQLDDDESGSSPSSASTQSSSARTPDDSIALRDLAFSFSVQPYVLVENPLNAEKLTALLTDSEDEETDDNLGDSCSEADFDI